MCLIKFQSNSIIIKFYHINTTGNVLHPFIQQNFPWLLIIESTKLAKEIDEDATYCD